MFKHVGPPLYIYIDEETDIKINKEEVLGKLKKALDTVEKYILSTIANDQISKGNFSIVNRFNELSSQYYYFRETASLAYTPKDNPNITKDACNFITHSLNAGFKANKEGGYNALAMIDAYFSRLEHFFVLALPFIGYDREKDNLANFIGSIWSEKFHHIFDMHDRSVKKHYDILVSIKEKYRNTFAHGGFEKNGQSFFFHLENFGAIPASMSGFKDSVHFNYFPIDKNGFENICSSFDDFDNYLSDIALPQAWKYANSALNLAFDQKNLSELLSVIKDIDTYDAWIEAQCYLFDMYANADY